MGMFSTLPILDSTPTTLLGTQTPQHTPRLNPKNLTLVHVEKFSHVVRALAPLAPPLVSLEMVNTLLALHPPDIDSMCLDFQLDSNFKLSVNYFKLSFLHMFHMLTHGPSSMVFKHLQDSFDHEDSRSGFIQLHQSCFLVAFGHIVWYNSNYQG
jgi:hypothetical protein